MKAVSRPLLTGPNDESLTREMFEIAQRAKGSDAVTSSAQMAARGAKSDVGLASLVRERQDLGVEWQRLDSARIVAASEASFRRDREAETGNVAVLPPSTPGSPTSTSIVLALLALGFVYFGPTKL